MIYMHPMSGLFFKIVMNEDTGKFYAKGNEFMKDLEFNPDVKEKYNQWWYETFESKFLGESDDPTRKS